MSCRRASDLRRGGFTPASGSSKAPRQATRTAPLNEAQKQLWLLLQIEKTSSIAYNVSTTLEFRGTLDVDRLRTALQRVVDRHSALRTTIAPDGMRQVIHERRPIELPLTDLSSGRRMGDRALARWRDEVSRQPIDLVRGPTFRPQLVRLERDRHVRARRPSHPRRRHHDGLVMKSWRRSTTNRECRARSPAMQFSELPPSATSSATRRREGTRRSGSSSSRTRCRSSIRRSTASDRR
jgi:hypothetical protein